MLIFNRSKILVEEEIAEKQRVRFQVLQELYKLSDGMTGKIIDGQNVIDNLNIDEESVLSAFNYLKGQNFIEDMNILNSEVFKITYKGVNAIEEIIGGLEIDSNSTSQTINFIRVEKMSGSTIQQGTVASTQNVNLSNDFISDLNSFVSNLNKKITDIDIDSEKKLELQADLKTIISQLNSPKPKISIIREALESLRSIIETGIGSAIGATLANQLPVLISQLPK